MALVIRQSLLETAKCLYRMHADEQMQVDTSSEFAERGRDFHSLAKIYVDYLVASQQEMDWSYAEALTIDANHNWNDEAVRIFRNWAEKTIVNPQTVFATEYMIRLDADGRPCAHEDSMYRGDLDRVDIDGTTATIDDYKTFWAISHPTTIQSIFYPWLLFKVMPHIQTVNFVLEFVRYPGAQRSRTFERAELPRMTAYVGGLVARLETAERENEWPATVNAGCVYCRHDCPLVQAGLRREAIGQVGTPEQARAIAHQLFALTKASKQAHAMLRAYASEHGSIELENDLTLGFQHQPQTEYDPRTILRLNEEHGFAKTRGLRVIAKEIERVGKEYPEYLERARKGQRDKSRTVFTFVSDGTDPLEANDDEVLD